jgi:putative oxidoreductase
MSTAIVRLHERLATQLARANWVSPLMLRVAVGLTFAVTGWGKLHHLEQVTAFFESLGIPAASVQAPFVAAVELVGGILVLVGLGTRIASLFLAAVMAVATLTAIWPRSDGIVALVGTIEVVYLLVFVHLVIHGAGAASIDHLVARRFAAANVASASTTHQPRGASA